MHHLKRACKKKNRPKKKKGIINLKSDIDRTEDFKRMNLAQVKHWSLHCILLGLDIYPFRRVLLSPFTRRDDFSLKTILGLLLRKRKKKSLSLFCYRITNSTGIKNRKFCTSINDDNNITNKKSVRERKREQFQYWESWF